MRLSVLDLVPVRTDQSSSDALAATVALAQVGRPRRLHPLLGGRAPQHAGRGRHVAAGPDRDAGRADRTHPARVRRRHAPQPRPAGRRRAVRPARGRHPGTHRPRHRSRPRIRSGHVDGAARSGWPRRHRHREVPAVPRRRRGADGRQRRAGGHPAAELRPQGHPGGRQRARPVVARLVDVLGSPRRGEGAAVRVRAPLLRSGHGRGAGDVPPRVPAQRRRVGARRPS